MFFVRNSDLYYTHYIVTVYCTCMICNFLQHGHTPIHLASRYGCFKVVEKLISSGAHVNVVNKVSVNY